jgi:hypothetical protein
VERKNPRFLGRFLDQTSPEEMPPLWVGKNKLDLSLEEKWIRSASTTGTIPQPRTVANGCRNLKKILDLRLGEENTSSEAEMEERA